MVSARGSRFFLESGKDHEASVEAQEATPGRQTGPRPAGQSSLKHWALLAACLAVACTGTWAVFEYVVWAKIPSEMAGKWVVQGGEQDGATFDFHRNGTMLGRINVGGNLHKIYADIRVEDKRLYSTTENPQTKQLLTRVQTIRTLTADRMVLEDERGNLLRLERAE